jgi:hypothetical protein
MFSARPLPLFLVQLIVKDDSLQLVPSLEDVRAAVLQSYDDIITATHNVDDISVKVS